ESGLGHGRDLQGLRRQRVRPVDAVRQRWPGSAALVLHAIRLMRTCTAGLTVALVITAPIAASAQARLAIPSTRLEPAPRSAPITLAGTHALRLGLSKHLTAIEARSGFAVEPSIGHRAIAVTVRRTFD